MKLISLILAWTLALPLSAAEDSTQVLQKIWSDYDRTEQFSVYGGLPETAAQCSPAALDIRNRAALEAYFCVPRQLGYAIAEGASLVHYMNRYVFSAAVFRLVSGQDGDAFAEVLRGSLRNTKWEGGRPQQYLMVSLEGGFVLVAFGRQQLLDTFLRHTMQVFPQGRILYNERLQA